MEGTSSNNPRIIALQQWKVQEKLRKALEASKNIDL
jgi:hypothetical protein